MKLLRYLSVVVIACLFSSPAFAKTWHVHNKMDNKYNVLFQATGCAGSVSCGTGGSGREYGTICKKKQVGPQEKISYDWGIGGQSNKRVIVCYTDGKTDAMGSTHSETYICPNSFGDGGYDLKGGSCD